MVLCVSSLFSSEEYNSKMRLYALYRSWLDSKAPRKKGSIFKITLSKGNTKQRIRTFDMVKQLFYSLSQNFELKATEISYKLRIYGNLKKKSFILWCSDQNYPNQLKIWLLTIKGLENNILKFESRPGRCVRYSRKPLLKWEVNFARYME